MRRSRHPGSSARRGTRCLPRRRSSLPCCRRLCAQQAGPAGARVPLQQLLDQRVGRAVLISGGARPLGRGLGHLRLGQGRLGRWRGRRGRGKVYEATTPSHRAPCRPTAATGRPRRPSLCDTGPFERRPARGAGSESLQLPSVHRNNRLRMRLPGGEGANRARLLPRLNLRVQAQMALGLPPQAASQRVAAESCRRRKFGEIEGAAVCVRHLRK